MPTKTFTIGGVQTGVGKTSVTLGLLRAFRRRGMEVQPFKVGPDFIDPGHHEMACGRPSHNVDGWMLDRETNVELFRRHCAGEAPDEEPADVGVVEGVMGLFDGLGGETEAGSTAEMSKWLGAPVVLVVDAWSFARSAAAVVKGFVEYDPDLDFAGVIFNRVAGESHLETIVEAVEAQDLDVPVLGGLPKHDDVEIPERHLGLFTAGEPDLKESYIDNLADLVEEHLDLEPLLDAAGEVDGSEHQSAPTAERSSPTVRIGLARDDAICFYYQENISLLKSAGAEIVEFSPMEDELPEDLDALYFGGGYPELHGEALAENEQMRNAVREFVDAGRPIYAECGGLMYLGESIEDEDGERWSMCGVFPFRTEMTGQVKIDYVDVEFTDDAPFFTPGETARGQLFHDSEIVEETTEPRGYNVDRLRTGPMRDGYVKDNVLASYIHLHFGSNPELAEMFVERCRRSRKGRNVQ